MNAQELRLKIIKGEFDINTHQLFFPLLIKGALYHLRKNVQVRGIPVKTYIQNTGDDIMYLEVKGQDASIEPVEISNEKFVYTEVPRAIVKPDGLNVEQDQLTNPYVRGNFEIETEDNLYLFNAEFRRMPVKFSMNITYYVDNFTDLMELEQELLSSLGFINTFKVVYLGQVITCSYGLANSLNGNIDFDISGDTSDPKLRSIELTIEVESSYPVFRPKTVICADQIISSFDNNLLLKHNKEEDILTRHIE